MAAGIASFALRQEIAAVEFHNLVVEADEKKKFTHCGGLLANMVKAYRPPEPPKIKRHKPYDNCGYKCIPTTYNGINFRSRLEAKWAVFFDLIGTEYLHEYEGYQLQSGWYVPDYWLPVEREFVEVKASGITTPGYYKTCFQKCQELTNCTDRRVWIYTDPRVGGETFEFNPNTPMVRKSWGTGKDIFEKVNRFQFWNPKELN